MSSKKARSIIAASVITFAVTSGTVLPNVTAFANSTDYADPYAVTQTIDDGTQVTSGTNDSSSSYSSDTDTSEYSTDDSDSSDTDTDSDDTSDNDTESDDTYSSDVTTDTVEETGTGGSDTAADKGADADSTNTVSYDTNAPQTADTTPVVPLTAGALLLFAAGTVFLVKRKKA